MKRKHVISIIIGIGAVSALLVVGMMVSAYFADDSEKDNTITPAENVLEISEDFVPPPDQVTGDNNIYKKEVSIANTGNAPCYIRVYMDFSDSGIRNRSYLSNDWNGSTGNFYSAERKTTGNTYIAKLSETAPNWIFVPDEDSSLLAGYYYYKDPVAVGGSTETLLKYVKTVNETVDDIQQYDIVVYAESVQISDMEGKVYSGYQEAWTDYLSK